MELDDLRGLDREIGQWLLEGLSTPHIAQLLGVTQHAAAARVRVVLAKLDVGGRRELRHKVAASRWRMDFARITFYVDTHGHSHIPAPYDDGHGKTDRLDALVARLRNHHSRKWPGRRPEQADPYPSIDWEHDLDVLEGWSWEDDD
jgi:DNA-binding CsgD family transcriptional regulator